MFTLSEFDEHRNFGHVNIYRAGTTVYEILGTLPIITPHTSLEAAKRKFESAVDEAESVGKQWIAYEADNLDPIILRRRLERLNQLFK